ncbi:MAG: hypothetical protein ACKO04_15135 [Actinomycetes bacterium]
MEPSAPLGSDTMMTTSTDHTAAPIVLGTSQVDLRDHAGLAVGDPVQVLSRFDARWLRGFAVAVVRPEGYQLRRLSDGVVLPAWFPVDHVRPLTDD